MRQARLEEAGISTLEQLVDADPAVVADLPGFHPEIVEQARRAALALLTPGPTRELPEVPDLPDARPAPEAQRTVVVDPPALPEGPPVTEPIEPSASPTSKRMKRGLEAARRLETCFDQIRQARARIRQDDRSAEIELKLLRRELKRLRKVLDRAQRVSIADGLSRRAAEDLDRLADRVDATLSALVPAMSLGRARKLTVKVDKLRHKVKKRLA